MAKSTMTAKEVFVYLKEQNFQTKFTEGNVELLFENEIIENWVSIQGSEGGSENYLHIWFENDIRILLSNKKGTNKWEKS